MIILRRVSGYIEPMERTRRRSDQMEQPGSQVDRRSFADGLVLPCNGRAVLRHYSSNCYGQHRCRVSTASDFRNALVGEQGQPHRMVGDLDAMKAMIDSMLTFAGEDTLALAQWRREFVCVC